MKALIVPTDFSTGSLNALDYAFDMACDIQASLSLIHVVPIPLTISEVPLPLETLPILIEQAEEKMKHLKEGLVKKATGRIHIYSEVASGTIINKLRDYCTLIKPYAVVMSPRGAGSVERLFFGSNTVAAMKHLSWPLIVVPPDGKYKNIKKIGLACDLKKVVETAPIEEIKKMVKEFHASLKVLHVNTGSEKSYGPEIIEQSGLLQEMLDELHPAYHFLSDIDVEKGISEFAEKNKLDLLIVVPKKHTLINKIFQKSHTKDLVLHTHVPVMAIHE